MYSIDSWCDKGDKRVADTSLDESSIVFGVMKRVNVLVLQFLGVYLLQIYQKMMTKIHKVMYLN